MKSKMLLTLMLLLLCRISEGQQTLKPGEDFTDITPHVQVLEDPSRSLTFAQVQASKAFKPSQKAIINFGFTESRNWLRFDFSDFTSEPLVLEIAHAFLPEANLFYTDSSGKTVELRGGYNVPVTEKVIKHHFQVFPLPKGKHTFYIQLISNSHPIRVRVYTAKAYDIRTYQQRLMHGFYIGFMLFAMLINLFFSISLRNRLYLFYAGIIIIYISYSAAVMDGFIVYFIPHIDLMFWYVTIPTIGVVLQLIYSLVFLEVKKYNPRLERFTKWLIGYFVLYMIVKFWLPLTTVLAFNTIHALISFFTMGYLGYNSGKKGNRLGYYFALAYFIYFLLVLTEAVYIQIGQPAYIFDMSHVSMATLIEAFILSFLLSKRFEYEKAATEQQKHEARAQLLEQTKENERIVREQNITLEKRVGERTKELEDTLEHLRQTQKQLIQSEKMASLGELTAGIAHEIQNPLNFVNNFSDMNLELSEELRTEIEAGNYDEAKAIALGILTNAEKINHHGKRADAIVKNMLQHSRVGSGIKEFTDINALADEYLRLSYHGLRAKDKFFNADFKTSFDESIPTVEIIPQDIGRVLLNLFNNAFYAVNEKKRTHPDFSPLVEVSTHRRNDSVVISVKDNGSGIPDKILNKIFQPFFTTKPTGEGTGLGLSLSYDIITKGHNGHLKAETKEGEGTTFIIEIPT